MIRPSPFPACTAEAAAVYLDRGFSPLPLAPRSKRPTEKDWSAFRADPNDLARFDGGNVGLLLGLAAGGLADVDLDCPEAVRAADVLLPPTGLVFGRPSAPRSYRLYRCATDVAPLKRADPVRDPSHPDGAVLAELRGTGQQTMAPPSLHPDAGERVAWATFDDPAVVTEAELAAAVSAVAAAALLGRYWPRGSWHEAALALAGGLLRAGWETGRAGTFVRAVCAAAGDEEVDDRVAAVDDTAKHLAHAGGAKATGWPKLAALIECRVVDTVTEWLAVTGGL